MDRARHRKSKSASGMDGIRQIQKPKAVSRLSADSRSNIDGSIRDDMPFVMELAQSNSGRASGTPMKKLLARELAKEIEPKRRSPGIIAKLMGLEGMPSPSRVHRQQKWSENHHSKNEFVKAQRNTLHFDGRSNSKSPAEQLEFKDVYEDLEASHVINQRSSSRWSANSMHMKPENVLSQQKLMDAKHLSTGEKFQHLKKMGDKLSSLDASKTKLLKFHEKPDFLFVKNLHDLQVDPSRSFHGRMTLPIPLDYAMYDGRTKVLKSVGDVAAKHDICPHPKRKDGLLLDPHNRHTAHTSRKSSKVQPEENNGQTILPTRIVVLKPNLGKVRDAGEPDLSHDYLPHFRKVNEHSSINCAEPESFINWKDSSFNMEFTKLMSNEAREKAREITRRMKDACEGTMDLMSSGFRGYAGDESSYDTFESESESDSEMFKLLSRNPSDTRCRYSSVESHVNAEAKHKLSERWTMAHRYQDVEEVTKERSLGEMLAKRDGESRPTCTYAKTSLNDARKELGLNNRIVMWNGPLGLRCRDARKDKTKKTSSRSRSLPPYMGGRSQRIDASCEALDKKLKHGKPVSNSSNKILKKNPRQKEGVSSRDSKSRSKKPLSRPHKSINEVDSSLGANCEIQSEAKIVDLTEKHPIFQTASKKEKCAISGSDVTKTTEYASTVLPPKHSKSLPKLESSSVDKDSAAYNEEDTIFIKEPLKVPSEQESSTLQCLGTEPDSSESSKEADHCSPISVLEIPFVEDTSSNTENFERVGAELRALRMQLQLLKMASGKFTEDVERESPTGSEQNDYLPMENWESSYIIDVLNDSCFEESGLDIFKTTWQTPECPLHPKLFCDLEKKYNGNTTVLKCQRKLLFDRINAALSLSFQQHINTCPWVMPNRLKLQSDLPKENLREACERLIWQDFADGDILEGVLDQEIRWFDFKEEIDAVGNEIEALIVDEMMLEVFM